MCGICGVVQWNGAGEPARDRVRAMRLHLEHRGPDDNGLEGDGRASLAATRLAIRGSIRSIEGHQPQVEPETGVIVVCNGEIDNHHELRRWLVARGRNPAPGCDVAVLPHLYRELGDGLFERLEGAFALAIWDPARGELFLARDRVGERPLFFFEREGEVAFATELAALVGDSEIERSLSANGLRHYLRFGRFPAPLTPFEEVRKVAPAEVVSFRGGVRVHRRYWRWSIGTVPARSPSIEEFDEVFVEAVRRQTDCDVDFGLFLSGGVDSSLVAAVARRLHPDRQLRSYTLRFHEASYDEGDAAARVAERLGLTHETVWVRPEDFPRKIRDLVRLSGEPLGDPAWVPTSLLAERAARDVKMVLVGEGGDEVFGGYPTYLGALAARRFERLPSLLRRVLSSIVRAWPVSDRKVALSFLLKRFVAGAGAEPLARHLLWTSVIAPDALERLGVASPRMEALPRGGRDLLDDLQRHDLESYLAEGLLTKVDRAAYGFALEPRAPFLDRPVFDFAATLPPGERVRGWTTKVFLKRYASGYLPRSVVYQRKRGLSVPLAAWLRGPLYDWARERLSIGLLDESGASPLSCLELLEEHRLRRRDWGRSLWVLVVLAEWLEWRASLHPSAEPQQQPVSSGMVSKWMPSRERATGAR
jgi:asparagine synthase (glutamine-hydrolysing)